MDILEEHQCLEEVEKRGKVKKLKERKLEGEKRAYQREGRDQDQEQGHDQDLEARMVNTREEEETVLRILNLAEETVLRILNLEEETVLRILNLEEETVLRTLNLAEEHMVYQREEELEVVLVPLNLEEVEDAKLHVE